MSTVNPFDRKGAYSRDFDLIKNASLTIAKYISLMTGDDPEECYKFVKSKFDSGECYTDIELKVIYRDEPLGDRKKGKIGLLKYLAWLQEEGHTVSPSMAVHCNSAKFVSYIQTFINDKIAARSLKKKLQKQAKMDNLPDLENDYYLGQTNDKYAINSLSGTLAVKHNPLSYMSGHQTLTSSCREVTTCANANNEKMFGGNRHYYTPEVTKANLAWITRTRECALLEGLIHEYDLHVPTVEETFEVVMSSARRYWRGEDDTNKIRKLIGGMKGHERAAVCYINDLRHLAELDDKFLRNLYDEVLEQRHSVSSVEEAGAIIGSLGDDLISLAGLLRFNDVKGVKRSDFSDDVKIKFASAAKSAAFAFSNRADIVQVLWANSLLPAEVHSLPNMERHSVAGSDTDSSLYTCWRQAVWYTGVERYTQTHIRVAALSQYIGSQTTMNTLLNLSAQMGVEDKYQSRLTMKPEFFFPCMFTTTKTKHYTALVAAKEGDVYGEYDKEVKGVGLRGSKVARLLHIASDVWYSELMEMVISEPPTPLEVQSVPAYLEHQVIKALNNKEVWPLSFARVNKKSEYKDPMSQDYLYYELWNTVFGPKYGEVKMLPSLYLKVSISVTKANYGEFTANMDEDMRQRFYDFMGSIKRDTLTQMFVPIEVINNGKLPNEINCLDIRGHISSVMARYYDIMECFGIYFLEPNNARLVSDVMTLEQAERHLIIDKDLLEFKPAH